MSSSVCLPLEVCLCTCTPLCVWMHSPCLYTVCAERRGGSAIDLTNYRQEAEETDAAILRCRDESSNPVIIVALPVPSS